MGRRLRTTPGGLVDHVLNRASGRATIFEDADDFAHFERALAEAHARVPARVLAYCAMPNHRPLLLRPERDGTPSRFAGRLALIHTRRRHARRGGARSGHPDRGRFKAFAVPADEHPLAVWRSIGRNPLRANLVRPAEDRRWSSLWRRRFGDAAARGLLSDGPLPLPVDWPAWVNGAARAAELAALRRCVRRGRRFGAAAWVADVVRRPGLEITMRPRGRPWRPQKGSRYLFRRRKVPDTFADSRGPPHQFSRLRAGCRTASSGPRISRGISDNFIPTREHS